LIHANFNHAHRKGQRSRLMTSQQSEQQHSLNWLAPGIVLLNRKYFPDREGDSYPVGATSFALNVIECLRRRRLLLGIVLYQRDESLVEPVLELLALDGRHAVVLRFHFGMPADRVRRALERAIAHFGAHLAAPPIVYHQTDTLLAYHPRNFPCCVTHHGPFVADFIARYSEQEAHEAYGGREKVEHLLEVQRQGVQALRDLPQVHVLQHSVLQREVLLRQGLSNDRISVMTPPILGRPLQDVELGARIEGFLQQADGELVLLSNVARVDYFKNLELLIEAACIALGRGHRLRVLITGGAAGDVARREVLLSKVPPPWRGRFLAIERLDQPVMFSLFNRLRGQAVFVCTSRYETLGITPLEAALSGVFTLAPALDWVEFTRFMPAECRYVYGANTLADHLESLVSSRLHTSAHWNAALRDTLSRPRFEDTFMASWAAASAAGLRRFYAPSLRQERPAEAAMT